MPVARSRTSLAPESQALALLRDGAAEILGRGLHGHETGLFHKYLNLLVKWNRVHRLTGSSEPNWIVEKLLLDSLLFLRFLPHRAATVADVGSGAGVPGIPLKIVRPDFDVALIEPRQRRASFLSAVIREVHLDGCRLINARVEALEGEFSHGFDAVVMRCAGRIGELCERALPLIRPGGVLVASGPPRRPGSHPGSWEQIRYRGMSRGFIVVRPP